MIFAPAPPRSTAANAAWTFGQSAVIWGLTLVIGPAMLLAIERRFGITSLRFAPQHVLGALVFVACAALNVWSAMSLVVRGHGTPLPMASPRELVIAGPFRYMRNPMAAGGIGQGIGIALWLGSWSVLLYAVAGAVVWHVLLRPAEERDLTSRFGSRYETYRRSIPLWLPRWRSTWREH